MDLLEKGAAEIIRVWTCANGLKTAAKPDARCG